MKTTLALAACLLLVSCGTGQTYRYAAGTGTNDATPTNSNEDDDGEDPTPSNQPDNGLPELEITDEQNFEVKDHTGATKTLKDIFNTEYMIIDFSQYWCSACKALADSKQKATDFHETVKGTKCRFMVALPEGDRSSWLNRYKPDSFIGSHSMFSKKQNSIGTAFGLNITGIPHIFMIDRKGNVVGEQGGGLPDEVDELCGE